MSLFKFTITIILAAMLIGCGQDTAVFVTFDGPDGLKSGTPVYLGDVQVGEVTELSSTGDATRAGLSLDPDSTAELKSGSAALFTTRDGLPAVELYNYRPGDEALQSGDELVGLNGAIEYAAWQTGEALDTGRKSMNEMTQSVKDYFESEEWQQQKDRMNQQLEAMREELGRAYEKTNEAYERFLKDLESESEAARERARESYAELSQQLRDQIARLKEQGDEHVVEPLRQLLEELSRAMEQKPEQEST